MHWMPGHEDIEGNEIADNQAKLAAKCKSSPAMQLPPLLRKGELPTSASALKQAFNKARKAKWKSVWSTSPRHRRISRIDNDLPSKSFLDLIGPLSRAEASIMMQLRTGHVPLNQHLARIGKVPNPHCPHCPHALETIEHFVLHCPKYHAARLRLYNALGRKSNQLSYLLSNEDATKAFLSYIRETKRWNCLENATAPANNLPPE